MQHAKLITALVGLAALPALPLFAAEKINYQDHVRPIFQQACFSCHNPDKSKGGVNLASYSATVAGGASGEIVAAQELDDSILYGVMAHTMEPKMPPKGDRVSDEQLAIIRQWIEQGLRETADGKAKTRKKPKADLSLGEAVVGRPDGPAIMPRELPMGPIRTTRRAGAVTSVAGHPWSPISATAGQRQVLIHHTQTGELLGVLPFDFGQPGTLRFSWSGKVLMVGGGIGGHSGTVVLYDVVSGEAIAQVGDEVDAVLAADLDPTQQIVALGGPNKLVKGYDVATGELLYKMDKHTDWVTAVAFSPDGQYLATGDRNGGLRVWEAETGEPIFTLEGHKDEVTALAWRYDGKLLASSGDDGQAMTWEMSAGNKVKSWGAHGGGARSIAWSEDGQLVTTGRDQRIRVWDSNGGRKHETHAFTEPGLSAAFDTDGKAVIAGDMKGRLVRWSLEDKAERVDEWQSNPPTIAVALSQSAEQLEAAVAALKQTQSFATERLAAKQQADEDVAASEQALKDIRAAIPVAEQTLKKTEQARVEAIKHRDAMNRAHNEAKGVYRKAEGVVRGAQNESNRAKQNHDRAVAEVKKATAELRKASEQSAEMDKQSAQASAQAAEGKAQAEQSRQKAEEAKRAADEGLRQAGDAKRESGEAQRRAEEAKRAADDAQRQADEAKKQAQQNPDDEGLKKKAGELARRAEELAAKARHHAETASAKAKQADERKRSADELGKKYQDALKQSQEVQRRSDDLNRKAQDAGRKAGDYANRMKQAGEWAQQRSAELDKLAEALAAAETKTAEAKEALQAKRVELDGAQQMAEEAGRELDAAGKAIGEARKVLDDTRRSVRPAEDRIKKAKQVQEQAAGAAAEAEQKLAASQAVADQAKRMNMKWRLAQMRQHLAELRGLLEEKDSPSLRQQLEKLEQAYRALRAEAGVDDGPGE